MRSSNTPDLPGQITAATSIDEVAIRLNQIVDESIRNNTRTGYFASLYLKVTNNVKVAIAEGRFEDGKRMDIFVTAFANRYFEALDLFNAGKLDSGPWKVAFDCTNKRSILILQHLLLGMNAHINLDLGVAAVEAVGDNSIQTIKTDFNIINDILGSMAFEVIEKLNQVSPLLSLFGLHGQKDIFLVQFSITNARDGAWLFAEALSTKTGDEVNKFIAERSVTIERLATALASSKGIVKFTLFIIHLFEWKNPGKVLEVLHKREKKYVTVDKTYKTISYAPAGNSLS